jgi:hypothetical protein
MFGEKDADGSYPTKVERFRTVGPDGNIYFILSKMETILLHQLDILVD